MDAATGSIDQAEPVEIEILAEDPAPAKPRRGPSRRTLIVALIALAVAAAGIFWILTPSASETTDDAYIAADASEVAPRVSGLVADVMVRDNQAVRAGQPLVAINPEEYDARAESASATLAEAEADVASARAALTSLSAEQSLAAATSTEAGTAIAAADAEAARAEADRQRFETLAARGFATRADLDARRASAIGARQAAARSRAQLAVTERSAGVTSARRATLEAALAQAEARLARARAGTTLAAQDRSHSVIRAPIDGVVGNRQVQRGDYVQPGSRLLTLVPLHSLYVTAYFKETQLRRMRPGQRATVHIDALGTELHGVVDSFAPGSGSTFSLLPFEPGTGSFTKIVQRIPVRIRFDPGQAGLDQLRPGLSVTASVGVAD
ncbi:MAG: HlyD family secretion protein [Pirellulales bacterium]